MKNILIIYFNSFFFKRI